MFQSNGFRLTILSPNQVQILQARNEREIIFGVRPSHISPRFEPSATSIAAEVYGLEPHGDYNIVTAKVGEDMLLANSSSDFFPEIRQTIHLEFSNNLHLFDAETKQNIFHGQGGRHG